MALEINPALEVQASRIAENRLCVVIDDFLLNPEEAVEFACANASGFTQLERSYPGGVLPVETRHTSQIDRFIKRDMSRVFGFCRGGLEIQAQYSLATLQPEEFTWIQRLCHSDPGQGEGRVNLAGLLYLFENPEMGGTGFYRWKDPEFWREMTHMQQADPDAGIDILREKFRMFRDPPRYMTESNEAAELVDVVPARYNRFVFYPGDLPHSAFITDPRLLSGDPAKGRLTLNFFVNAVPGS